MKQKILSGVIVAALITGLVAFSSFSGEPKRETKQSKTSELKVADPGNWAKPTATHTLYFTFNGTAHSPQQMANPANWIARGTDPSGYTCGGGTIVCLVKLEPQDNPGIAENDDPEVAAAIFADYLQTLDDIGGSYDSSIEFVEQNYVSLKS